MKVRGVRLIWGVIVLLSVVGGFWLCSSSAKAGTPKIIISEVQYHPENPSGVSSKEKEYEWFELYNPGDLDLDLKGWTVKDNSASNIIPDLTIKSKNYAVVVAKKTAFEENFTGLNINLVELAEGKIGNGLANSADELSFFDDQGTLVDTISWTEIEAKDFDQGVSISRDETTGVLYEISPPHPGFVPVVQVYSDDLKVNEILPNPETGNDEFVELVNLGDQAIDLKNWQIDDAEGGSAPFVLSGIINPKSYLVFYQKQTFNNDGDMVRLFDPNGEIKDSITYGKAARGQSYSKFSDGWAWTETPTPGAENIKKISIGAPSIILADQPSDQPIETAKTLELNQQVITSGQVTVPPGVLSNQYFYLEDSTGGIQVYNYGKDFPEIKEGFMLSVTGILSQTRGEKRLKIESAGSVIVTNPTESVMTPEPIDQPENNLVGKLISLKGKISKNSGGSIYLENQDPSFRIYILTQTGIKKPRLHKGDEIEVSGVLSYYQSYYRLLPRYQDDIKIINSTDALPESGSDIKWILILAGLITLIFYGKNFTQSKRNQRFCRRFS